MTTTLPEKPYFFSLFLAKVLKYCKLYICNTWECRRDSVENSPACWSLGKTTKKKYAPPLGSGGSQPTEEPWPSISDFRIANVPHRWGQGLLDIYYLTLQNQARLYDYKLQWSADASSCSAECPSGGPALSEVEGCGSGWSGMTKFAAVASLREGKGMYISLQ